MGNPELFFACDTEVAELDLAVSVGYRIGFIFCDVLIYKIIEAWIRRLS